MVPEVLDQQLLVPAVGAGDGGHRTVELGRPCERRFEATMNQELAEVGSEVSRSTVPETSAAAGSRLRAREIPSPL
jgi:hypothetical protein